MHAEIREMCMTRMAEMHIQLKVLDQLRTAHLNAAHVQQVFVNVLEKKAHG